MPCSAAARCSHQPAMMGCLIWLCRKDGLFLDRREDIPDPEVLVRAAEAEGKSPTKGSLCPMYLLCMIVRQPVQRFSA